MGLCDNVIGLELTVAQEAEIEKIYLEILAHTYGNYDELLIQ